MKTITRIKESKVRKAVLTGIIAITGSASAFAAAPEAPTIDWVEASVSTTKFNDVIEVNAGWSSDAFEDVYSVQYRVDGKPVKSHEVKDGQTFGDIDLQVNTEEDFDLTIALCNAEGCTESETANISISDTGQVDVIFESVSAPGAERDPSFGHIASPTDALQDILNPQFELMNTSTGFLADLASVAGKAVLSGVLRGSSDVAIQALLKHLGLAGDDFGAQLDDMQNSLDSLNGKIASLTTAIQNLNDEVTWQGFLTQHLDANSAVNKIYSNYEDVVGWIASGQMPDTGGWNDARTAVRQAVTDLAGSRTNQGGGIVDVRDGAIYQLMDAIPQNVTSTQSYWPIIDEYRDYYRTAIAFGYLTLDMIAREYDSTGTTEVMANNALEAGQMSVLNMYSYGISPELPMSGTDVFDFIHLRGKTVGWTNAEAADLDDLTNRKTAGVGLRDEFFDIQEQYRMEHHDNQTLENFLKSSNIETRYVYDGSGGYQQTGWQVTQLTTGKPHLGIAPTYKLLPRTVQIKNNSWVESNSPLCGPSTLAICGGVFDDVIATWDESDILPLINERKAAIAANGGFKMQNGSFVHTHYGLVDLTNRMNHAGHSAELDEDLVRLAAFGDGAAVLTTGSLPGVAEGSECIGLPETALRLMEVEDYHLRWQPDGNLTLRRNADNKLKWVAKTRNNADRLCWQSNGNLVIYNGTEVTFETDTSDDAFGGYGGRVLKLHQDGALQIVNELDDVIWWKGTM